MDSLPNLWLLVLLLLGCVLAPALMFAGILLFYRGWSSLSRRSRSPAVRAKQMVGPSFPVGQPQQAVPQAPPRPAPGPVKPAAPVVIRTQDALAADPLSTAETGQPGAAPRPSLDLEPVGLRCPHCNEPNRAGAKFCRSCGRSLIPTRPAPRDQFCWNCGQALRPTSQYCSRCGSPV